MGGSRIIAKRKTELTRDGEARERERENEREGPAAGSVCPTDGCGQRTRDQVEPKIPVFIPQPSSPRSITLAGRPRGIPLRMSPKPISTLALPRSTLFALSQAGYETTDELASSTPEGLAKGKPVFPDQWWRGHTFLMGILSSFR